MNRLAWVFSGGGAKGAFGAGVFQRILEIYPTLRWQIVTGTSTGSLIAPFAALADADRARTAQLVELYGGIRKKDVFQSNFLFNLFDLPEGLVNLKPLRKVLNGALPQAAQAALAIGAVDLVVPTVNLQTAALTLCTQERNQQRIRDWYSQQQIPVPLEFWPFADLNEALLASSAVPLGTTPIQNDNRRYDYKNKSKRHQYVDGGVFDKAPLREALALGASEAIVVMMSPTQPQPRLKPFDNLIEVGLRAVDLLQDELLRGDIDNLGLAQVLYAQGVSADALARQQVAPEVCGYLHALESARDTPAGTAMANPAMQPVIIEPQTGIGSGEDFDSLVASGWPESPEADGGKPTNIPIMQARIAYGRRVVDALLAEPGSRLKAVLDALTLAQ
ncbi:MAG: patatin-like phospholipase family protein [Xanthomonadales bacterium]|nr:patatin-like phospholipase family protein [Xanthomonadales bacterium]MDZ4114535.1 patatin-like phospholipase family protein [Xanthomonadaceae bacterium]